MPVNPKKGLSLFKEWLIEQSRAIAVPVLVLCLVGVSVGINMHRYTRGVFRMYPIYAGDELLVAKTFVCIAEVCFGLLLLPVSRGLVTWLRSTWLRHIIDFDTALNFHAWLAVIGLGAATVHGVCATIAYSNVGKIPFEIQEAVGRNPKDVAGMLLSWNILSGWALFAMALVTFPFALRWPRQAPWLKDTRLGKILNNPDLFWVTHHILIIVFIPGAVMHSIKWTPGFPSTHQPAFLMKYSKFFYYIVVPVIIYLFNRLQRIATASHLALVVDAGVVGGDVLALKVLKPRFFSHKPGQYLFLCCPKISPYEWHPFTITSSPQDSFISLHIKRAGDWTGALHDLFKPATRGYSSSGGTANGAGSTVAAGPSTDGNSRLKQHLLPPAATKSSAPATAAGPGVTLLDHHADAAHLVPASGASSTAQELAVAGASFTAGVRSSMAGARRRISVDMSARLAPEATMSPARTRRSSAPGFAMSGITSGRVTTEGNNIGNAGEAGAPLAALSNVAKRVGEVMAGAWDRRADMVIVEAETRLKQAVAEIAGGNHASCSAPGVVAPAFAAFSGYSNARPNNDNSATSTMAASAAAAVTNAAGRGQVVVAGSAAVAPLAGVKEDEEEVFVPPLLYIDGPFGAPTQDFEHYKVVVLIGTGIGITPMASVLRSLMHDLYDARCETCGTLNRRLCRMRQNKVYVHWVTKNLEGMAWFEELLSSISVLDVDHVFQFNVHITRGGNDGSSTAAKAVSSNQIVPVSAHGHDANTAAVSCAVVAVPAAGGVSKDSKPHPLPVNYSYKRPDMFGALSDVQAAHCSEFVGVFFCGPRTMGQQVQRACRHLNAAAKERASQVEMDPEAPACPRPCRLYFHEEIF